MGLTPPVRKRHQSIPSVLGAHTQVTRQIRKPFLQCRLHCAPRNLARLLELAYSLRKIYNKTQNNRDLRDKTMIQMQKSVIVCGLDTILIFLNALTRARNRGVVAERAWDDILLFVSCQCDLWMIDGANLLKMMLNC